jgi:NAD(P)-dependent dehydrogenase (short-subunit alcohol dehydrogenase family)
MNKPFKNRRVLLTGAAGGIGSAIARYFLEAGAVVAGSDSQNGMLAALQETLGSAGNNFVPVAADLTISGALGDLVDRSWALLGGLDTLVNCAAVYPVHPILQMSESDWDRVIAINLKAPFFLSQAFARRLVEASRPGHIVNISSGNAERARAGAAHYSASKAGLEMLTRTYALEFAKHRIHVNSVSPGFIDVQSSVSPL